MKRRNRILAVAVLWGAAWGAFGQAPRLDAPNMVEISLRLATEGVWVPQAPWRRLIEGQLRKHDIAFEIM